MMPRETWGLLSLSATIVVSLMIAVAAWAVAADPTVPLVIAAVAAVALVGRVVVLVRREAAERAARLDALSRDGFDRERIEGQ